jgi:hypothetical protein
VLAIQAYGIVWLVAEWQAHRIDPTRIEGRTLMVNVGLRARAEIPFDAIETVRAPGEGREGVVVATAAAAPTVELVFRAPIVVSGLAGRKKETRILRLSLDEPERFRATIEAVKSSA